MKKLSKKIRFLMATLFAVVLAVCAVGIAACSSSSDGDTKTTTDLSVGLNYYSMTLEPGGEGFALKAVVSGTHTGGYEWSTSSNVVTIAPAGDICVVTPGNVEGYAKVTLTVDNLSASCDVYVAKKVVAESITLTPSSLELAVGEERTVEVTVNMTDNNTSDDFSFKVSEGGVVTVTKTGSKLTVKANMEGEATITVTAEGAEDATIPVKVTAETSIDPKLTGVTLDSETLALDLNGTSAGVITATIADSGYSYTWTGSEWSSSNESVATVAANGNEATVTAIGVGSATITVKLNKTVSASCKVTVTDSSQSGPEPVPEEIYTVTVSAANGKERITVGEEIDLTTTITDANGNVVSGEDGQIAWSTDDNSVVTLAENEGHVTGCGVGQATITAKYTDENGNWGEGTIIIIVAAAEEKAEGDDYNVEVNFSQESGVGTETTVTFDEKGVVSYIDLDLAGSVNDGKLNTATFTKQSDSNYTNYILVDFSSYVNYNFEISVDFTSTETNATLAVVDSLDAAVGSGTGSPSGRFGSSKPDLSDLVEVGYGVEFESSAATLTYSGKIYDPNMTEEGEKELVNGVVYIVWDSAVEITKLNVELWTGDRSVQLDENWEGLDIDFSNPPQELRDYYTSLNSGDFTGDTTQGIKVENGVLTLIDVMAETNWKTGQKYIDTGASKQYGSGYTTTAKDNEEYGYSYDDALTNYFIINLHGLGGQSVVVTIVYTTPEGTSGTLYLTTAVEDLENGGTPTAGYILASGAAGTDQKLSAAVIVPADGLMYIEYSGPMYIKSLKISFGAETDVDTTPVYDLEIDTETTSINLTIKGAAEGTTYGEAQLGYKVTANGQLLQTLPEGATISWSSSNPAVATVDGTGKVTAISEGFALITVTFKYEAYGIELESGSVTINVVKILNDGGIHINFSDSSWAGAISTGVINLTDAGEEETATLQYKASNVSGIATDDNGVTALKTGNNGDNGSTHFSGSTTSDDPLSDATNYFIINIPEGATYMEITVKFSSVFSTADVAQTDHYSGFLALTKEIPTSLWTANGSAYNEKKNRVTGSLVSSDAIMESTVKSSQLTFTWKGYVEEWGTLYIMLGSSQYIYSLDVYFTSPGHTHEYNGAVTWTWTETSGGGWTATATTSCSAAECNHDESATITVRATVTSVTTEPTCTEDGKIVYTATATISDSREVSDTKEITIAALGHDFEISYVENVEGKEDGWYYTCTRGDVVGEAITDGTGLTFNVTSLAELQAALNLSGAVVVLESDIVGSVTVSESVTLDLAGHKLINAGESGAGEASHTIEVLSGGKLTIEDTGDGQGIVDNISAGCAAIFVDEGGEAVLEGGTFTRSEENATGGAYYTIVNHGEVVIKSGVTVKTEAETTSSMIENGWATASDNETNATATLTISGGTFEGGANNLIKNDDYGKLVISGGTFTGKGVSVILNYGELEISGNATFTQESTENGSLVVWNKEGGVKNPTAKISGGSFTGGATATLYNDASGEMTISGGTFENSLYAVIYSEGKIEISGGTFKSTGTGLQIYVVWAADGTVDISKGTFTAGDGSDYLVVAGGEAEVTISGGTFSGPTGATMLYTYKASEAEEITATITVTGGSFSADPTGYVKPGFAASENDGTYTVVEEVYTVTITGTRRRLAVGSTGALEATVVGNVNGEIENPTILWSADNNDLITLAQDEGTFTIGDTVGTVIITATYEYAEGLEATGTIKIEIVNEGEENNIVHLDFADPDTYSWITTAEPPTTAGNDGAITLVEGSSSYTEILTDGRVSMHYDSSTSGETVVLILVDGTYYEWDSYMAIRTGSAATSTSNKGFYFAIDVSDLDAGETLTVSVEAGRHSASPVVVLATSVVTNSQSNAILGSLDLSGSSAELKTETWVVTIPENCDTLYVYSMSSRAYIHSIDITIGEVTEEGDAESGEEAGWKDIYIDFSDPDTYSWIITGEDTIAAGTYTDESGEITLTAGSTNGETASVGESVLSIVTNSGDETSPSYFAIDISSLEVGQTISIEISWIAGGGRTSMMVTYEPSSSNTEAINNDLKQTGVSSGTSKDNNFKYTKEEGKDIIYICWSQIITVSSIKITLTE